MYRESQVVPWLAEKAKGKKGRSDKKSAKLNSHTLLTTKVTPEKMQKRKKTLGTISDQVAEMRYNFIFTLLCDTSKGFLKSS